MQRSITQVEEAAAAAIVAEQEAAEARVVSESLSRLVHGVEAREVIIVDSPTLTIGFITQVAQLLEQRGIRVCVRWSRDDRGLISGVSLCEALS